MPRCAVLGSPIQHSLSPVLHRAAYTALGLSDWRYDAIEVPEGGLAAFVGSCGPEWAGLSLTMPLKREALALVPASDLAKRARAINTLSRREDEWYGDNTDVPGAARALVDAGCGSPQRAAVIGGGATAGSMVLAFEALGCTEVQVLSRSAERSAEALAVSPIATWSPLAGDLLHVDVVASTIPAQAQDAALVDRCGEAEAVFEVIYDPWPTPLAAAALARGATVVTGLDLLVNQAALQVAMHTGAEVSDDVVAAMRAAGGAVWAVD